MRPAAVLSAFALLGAMLPAMAAADAPVLEQPVDCRIGEDCAVQNYVDHDPGQGFADFTCGGLGYDGHKGTDIRVPTLAEMREGVAVLAAAGGVVLRLRDGMADVSTDETGREAVSGREAGNSVIIDHGDGWETQYSHLRQGSITVRPNERVQPGQKIALIGLSGDTEFPHLHFELRHRGVAVDPYRGPDAPAGCGTGDAPMWSAAAGDALAYRATGLLAAGFAQEAPDYAALLAGRYAGQPDTAPADAPALVFWSYLFGVQAGDRITVSLVAPDGSTVAENEVVAERAKADFLAFAGRKRPGEGWPEGSYVGRFTLKRTVGGETTTIVETDRALEMH